MCFLTATVVIPKGICIWTISTSLGPTHERCPLQLITFMHMAVHQWFLIKIVKQLRGLRSTMHLKSVLISGKVIFGFLKLVICSIIAFHSLLISLAKNCDYHDGGILKNTCCMLIVYHYCFGIDNWAKMWF